MRSSIEARYVTPAPESASLKTSPTIERSEFVRTWLDGKKLGPFFLIPARGILPSKNGLCYI